jgi:hypothetical protein
MDLFSVIIAVFGMIAVLVVAGMKVLSQAARRRLLHQERMLAIEKGVPLPEDLDAELEAQNRQPTSRLDTPLAGTVLTALGLGMLAAGRFVPRADLSADTQRLLAHLQLWAWPVTFVGLGLLLYSFVTRRRNPR